jgi:hypothetical protein
MKVSGWRAVAVGLAAVGVLGAVGAGGAVAGGLITSRQIAHGAIHTDNIHRHAVTLPKLSRGARKALRGKRGRAGVSAVLSVKAVTHLSNRPDSGNTANWATDAITRTATVTRQARVPASNCGTAAIRCWFYTGLIGDTGSFATDPGAPSPNAGTAIQGTVTGTVKGVDHFEFYSDAARPQAALVPKTVTGDTDHTSAWMSLFFPSSATVTTPAQLGWRWSYVAGATCETWVDAASGESGDITGIDACK